MKVSSESLVGLFLFSALLKTLETSAALLPPNAIDTKDPIEPAKERDINVGIALAEDLTHLDEEPTTSLNPRWNPPKSELHKKNARRDEIYHLDVRCDHPFDAEVAPTFHAWYLMRHLETIDRGAGVCVEAAQDQQKGVCTIVACAGKTAVYFCNHLQTSRCEPQWRIGQFVRAIFNKCAERDQNKEYKGQLFVRQGFNVGVWHTDVCPDRLRVEIPVGRG